jgi:hypothetical protein
MPPTTTKNTTSPSPRRNKKKYKRRSSMRRTRTRLSLMVRRGVRSDLPMYDEKRKLWLTIQLNKERKLKIFLHNEKHVFASKSAVARVNAGAGTPVPVKRH